MLDKVIRHAYLCDGRPECYGDPNCGLSHDKGCCTHTTDICYAVNRKRIMHDVDYIKKHVIKVADSDWEELYFEK